MKREDVFACTQNCINGKIPTCTAACPFGVDLKSFLKKAGRGKIDAAAAELAAALPFPVLISRLCPGYCEKACQRMTVMGEETIAVNLLERSCLALSKKEKRKTFRLPLQEKRVAVIGAGPAGLALALQMDTKRFRVTVFEKEAARGGSLSANPQFALFEEEFEKIFADTDVEFVYEKKIETLQDVEKFDLVYIATGRSGCAFGLEESFDDSFGTTSKERVFAGGEVTGVSVLEGLAASVNIAKAMEAFVQTGTVEHAAVNWQDKESSKPAPHIGQAPSMHVVPSGELYTADEVKAEAGRCMMCDCEECMKFCELLNRYKKKPPRIAIDIVQDGMTRNSVSSACITRQTWSCNECGYCKSVCGEEIDIGRMFEMSRLDRVSSGNYPTAFHGYWLREMRMVTQSAHLAKQSPYEKNTEYVFFPGCRLGAANPLYVTRSYEKLLQSNPSTGILLDCCGIPALWAGEGKVFKEHLDMLRKTWEDLGRPIVIYACASCARTFERFLPEIPIRSLYEVFCEGQEFLPEAKQDKVFAVFDPCAAKERSAMKAAVRKLAAKAGTQISAYESSGKCCGFGGHIQLANPQFYDEVAETRIKECEEPYLVYCTNCREVFASHGKDCTHILDLIFDLPVQAPCTLEDKKEHLLAAKQELMHTYWKEDFIVEKEAFEALNVVCSPEAETYMEHNLIPIYDIKKTIWINEQEGDGFENASGETICKLKGDYITCWVRYIKDGETYQVSSVYSHRMTIREDQ